MRAQVGLHRQTGLKRCPIEFDRRSLGNNVLRSYEFGVPGIF